MSQSSPAAVSGGVGNAMPVNPAVAYAGPAEDFGTEFDPALGMIHGGFIPFGGGLALYNSDWQIVGGLGVSGSSACEDHVVAWRVRGFAELDYVPSGPSGTFDDDLVFKSVKSTHGWGHPDCLGTHAEREAQAMLKSVMLKDTLPDDRLDIR